jgi:hypothetical protein
VAPLGVNVDAMLELAAEEAYEMPPEDAALEA